MTFDEFWRGEVERNGGYEMGADYRHWALKGFKAAGEEAAAFRISAQALCASLVKEHAHCSDEMADFVARRLLEAGIAVHLDLSEKMAAMFNTPSSDRGEV